MSYRKITTLFIGLLVVAASVSAITPGDDLLIAGAARTNRWHSDLYINNPGDSRVEVDVMWLIRDQTNPNPTTRSYFVDPEETLILVDVLFTEFNLSNAAGAFRITADDEVTANLIVYAGFNDSVGGTLGSGFEAIPASVATSSGEETFLMGVANAGSFYTNIFALAGANGVTMELDLLDPDGAVLDTAVETLGAYEPWLSYKTDIWNVGSFSEGTLRARVTSGSAAILGSKVDSRSEDPTTLESTFGGGAGSVDGVYQISTYDSLGYASGGELEIANAQVIAIDGTYSNFDKVDNQGVSECTLIFLWGVGLGSTPVGDFASGVDFTDTYYDDASNEIGEMAWTVTFTVDENLGFSGTLDAVGSGWSGDDAGCNGTFPALDLFGGKAN